MQRWERLLGERRVDHLEVALLVARGVWRKPRFQVEEEIQETQCGLRSFSAWPKSRRWSFG